MRRAWLATLITIAGCGSHGLPGPEFDGGADLIPATVGGASCVTVVECVNNCVANDHACEQACIDLGTADAQGLMESLIACLESQCPHHAGGVCDPAAGTSAACDACLDKAQEVGGACDPEITACDNG